MTSLKILTLVALALAGLLVGTAGAASAHEHRKVADGKYHFILGWRSEPAYVDVPNGLELAIFKIPANATWTSDAEGDRPSATGNPFTGLSDADLTVTYEYGGKTFTPPQFRAAFEEPGHYTADVTPTQPGRYTIHVVGTLEGHAIDARVNPDDVDSGADAQFPTKVDSVTDLTRNVTTLQKDVNALKASKQTSSTPVMTSGPAGSTTPAFAVGALVGASVVAAASVAYVRRDRVKRRER